MLLITCSGDQREGLVVSQQRPTHNPSRCANPSALCARRSRSRIGTFTSAQPRHTAGC